jgi:hypothetical protein
MKSFIGYTNLLSPEVEKHWQPIEGLEGSAWYWTIAEDPKTGHYTRLTKFGPGCDTTSAGSIKHDYQEEVLILQGDLYDAAFDITLVAGDYCCRRLHEVHGPFKSRSGCVVFEVAYPEKRK